MSEIDPDKIRLQLRKWQERLLDLKKSNPLLGLNRSRVSKLRVTKPSSEILFQKVVLDGKELRMPLVQKVPTEGPRELPLDGEDALQEKLRVQPGDVEFDASPEELRRRLRRIFDNARTTVEERGVTTLFLTFGVLGWKDAILGESVSPLWMVPCELVSKGPDVALRLIPADEEMQLNPALEYYLRERHKVDLPEIPENPDTQSLASFLNTVQRKVKEQGWAVEPDVWLSTFSFESLVIYQDIKALADIAVGNAVVAALARASALGETSEALRDDLDSLETPDAVPIPILETDSSQLEALAYSAQGRHVVVHGPPGTGKSQTISNLIADALGRNKKVLFVSAKMAALNVVYERLKEQGLGRFCLEAHSTKAGKAHIIDDLRRTLEAESIHDSGRLSEELQSLVEVRQRLNEYVRELHQPVSPLDISIYQALGKTAKLHAAPEIRASLPWPDILTVGRSDLSKALDAMDQLVLAAAVFDERATHPWRGFVGLDVNITDQETLEDELEYARDALMDAARLVGSIGTLVVAPETLLLSQLEILAPALESVAASGSLPRRWWSQSAEDLEKASEVLKEAAALVDESVERQGQYEAALEIPHEIALRILAATQTTFAPWYRRLTPAYWRWRRDVLQHLKPKAKRHFAALCSYHQLASRLVKIDAWFQEQRLLLLSHVGEEETRDRTVLLYAAHLAKVAADLRRALDLSGCKPMEGVTSIEPAIQEDIVSLCHYLSNNDAKLTGALKRIGQYWTDGFIDGETVYDSMPSRIAERCSEVLAAVHRIREWLSLQRALHACREIGLANFVEQLGETSSQCARQAFERRFFTIWASTAMERSKHLAEFSSARRNDLVERYRLLDARIRRSARERIKALASEPAYRVRTAREAPENATEVGILRYELRKKKRIKPLRKLFAEIPHVLQALKPCMLMSPLSVSTFLKPGALEFDLVVFDEASQLPTAEGIPSILRAKQVVVAGDANQLPPTSFFEASLLTEDDTTEEEESAAVEPLESLLDDCVAVVPVFQETYLRWHYRSRDERLIKFSNHYFYENGLITFPSSAQSDDRRGVHHRYIPDGIWDRGRSRTNRREAREVARMVISHYERCPERSLGVVALNSYQREAIEDAVQEELQQRPDLVPFFDATRSERFFVKSLESVQGDERDTMIISVGYGKDADGALTMNFGPINRDGGWRRLNVLVTRAKWETILVTSLRSQELGGINPQNRGAVALRNFIEYAEHGAELPAAPAYVTGAETNDFEDAVQAVLQERGYEVEAQVGASRFRIDLAIRDKRDRLRYLLGIECDGATYHSSRTARDRDLVRQQILQRMGWRLHRVWSTEWFYERERAIDSILRSIGQAEAVPVEELVPAPSPPSEAAPPASRNNPADNPVSGKRAHPSNLARTYSAGRPYARYQVRHRRNRDILLKSTDIWSLADEIVGIVAAEGPIHQGLLVERLKEIHNVARAGSNVQNNISQAIKYLIRKGHIHRGRDRNFLLAKHNNLDQFRLPVDGVRRPLELIAPEEIELAILHLVEDQFGVMRGHLPSAVAGLLGIERLRAESADRVRNVTDDLINRGRLRLSGQQVHLP